MATNILADVLRLRGIKPGPKFVLVCLADHAGTDGKNCFPSMRLIADETGISLRSVQSHIRQLELLGHIEIKRPSHQGRGKYNRYEIRVQNSRPSEEERVQISRKRVQKTSIKGAATATEPSLTIKNQRRCPPGFEITQSMKDWAKVNAPLINPHRALGKFKDHTFASPKGDWTATFRNWVRSDQEKAERFQPKNYAAPVPDNPETKKIAQEAARALKTAELRDELWAKALEMGLDFAKARQMDARELGEWINERP